MKEITFPGFNLNFQIDSIAINVWGISIYWYAIFIVLAFVIAILIIKKDKTIQYVRLYCTIPSIRTSNSVDGEIFLIGETHGIETNNLFRMGYDF